MVILGVLERGAIFCYIGLKQISPRYSQQTDQCLGWSVTYRKRSINDAPDSVSVFFFVENWGLIYCEELVEFGWIGPAPILAR